MLAKFSRYFVTGGSAAVVDVLGFRLFLLAGTQIGLAAVASWLLAAFVNYQLTSRFVFKRAASQKGGLLFLVGAAIGLSINLGVTLVFSTHLGVDPVLSKILGIGFAFVCNFFINLLWVFR